MYIVHRITGCMHHTCTKYDVHVHVPVHVLDRTSYYVHIPCIYLLYLVHRYIVPRTSTRLCTMYIVHRTSTMYIPVYVPCTLYYVCTSTSYIMYIVQHAHASRTSYSSTMERHDRTMYRSST